MTEQAALGLPTASETETEGSINSPLSVHVTFGLVPQVPGHRQNVTWTPTKRFLFLIKIFIWREARPGRRPGQGRGVA